MALNIQMRSLFVSLPHQTRCLSQLTNVAVARRRTQLFELEEQRQRSLVGRIEKTEVSYQGVPENSTLVMNRRLSTPHDCAKHISEAVMERAVLAEVNGVPHDMHQPIAAESCTLKYLYFHDDDPFHVNKAFWRSCSLMLGAVLEEAFKDQHYVQLHSFPNPNVRSGSFVYDVQLPLADWRPTAGELRVLSAMMRQLGQRAQPLRRLDISTELALDMFTDNQHKYRQVPLIAKRSQNGDRVTVYRCEHHVDLSCGPAMSHTGLLGRCSITSVHRIQADCGQLYRIQGVALPRELMLNHFAYGLLEDRSRQLNPARIPSLESQEEPDPATVAAAAAVS